MAAVYGSGGDDDGETEVGRSAGDAVFKMKSME